MNTVHRTITADKAGMLEYLEEQRAYTDAESRRETHTIRVRREYAGYRDGLAFAMGAIGDWALPQEVDLAAALLAAAGDVKLLPVTRENVAGLAAELWQLATEHAGERKEVS